MTSSINPNNIDGAYPVAGQDNNSQGFRDNFTNTSTNFQYAANEITDLQNNSVLKSALTGTTLNNNMNGSILSNFQGQNISSTVVSLGTLSGSVGINYAAGSYQTVTTSGSISLAFTNFTPAGTQDSVIVQVTVASVAHTLTLPAAVSVNASGIQGIDTTTNVIEFAATGVYAFNFVTSNGGTTITVTEANKPLQPFNNSQQDLASAGAISLATTISYFSTAGSETATLADGVEGQIKTLICTSYVGDMVVTVATAGWKTSGSGTITFGADGRACTLQYVQGAWYCIGNNAAVFA
jgi:hypothetical protein